MFGSFALLIFLFILAVSKYGNIKIKLENKSEFSIFSWCSMLFAAGIGATILYWSTIEWIDYYNILKLGDNKIDREALLYSRTYPVFHWGLTAWAIYCLPVVAFSLALHKNPNSNLTFSGILNIKNIVNDIIKIYNSKHIHVMSIAISKKYRKTGCGSKLLNHLMQAEAVYLKKFLSLF